MLDVLKGLFYFANVLFKPRGESHNLRGWLLTGAELVSMHVEVGPPLPLGPGDQTQVVRHGSFGCVSQHRQ